MNGWGLGEVVHENGKVKGMKLRKCISVRDAEGRFSPTYDDNTETFIPAENILMAVGQRVDLSFLSDKYRLELTKRGLLSVDDDFRSTSNENVYAGGDAVSGPATVIKAIASGHKAANSMNKALGISPSHACEDTAGPKFTTFNTAAGENYPANHQQKLPAEERSLEKEDLMGLSKDAVMDECQRCANCGCLAVNPSDISNVLVAADAIIHTNKRAHRAKDFFTKTPLINRVLEPGEIVTEIEIPACDEYITHYEKMRLRDSIDFALLSIASAFKLENGIIEDARIVLGGAAPVAYRLVEVERYLKDKEPSEDVAETASSLAVKDALPLRENKYKIEEIKVHVKRTIQSLTK